METSRLKDQWRSETDQDKKGETEKMHLRMERSSIYGNEALGTNVERFWYWSKEVRNLSMERYG